MALRPRVRRLNGESRKDKGLGDNRKPEGVSRLSLVRRIGSWWVSHARRHRRGASVFVALLTFGGLAFGETTAFAATAFPTSPQLDNFATDTSPLNPLWATPALGEAAMRLDTVAHEFTGTSGGWNAAVWDTSFAAPVEVWATISRAGSNAVTLYADVTGGASGTVHPASGYFAEFGGASLADGVSLWRVDGPSDETRMTFASSPYTNLNAGDEIGLSASSTGVIIAWYKPLGGAWSAVVSWHDVRYLGGSIAIEAIPGVDYGFRNFGGGNPSKPVSSTITTTAIRASVPGVNIGQQVTYTATVSPTPVGGSISFVDDGVPIPSCNAQPIDGNGEATCAVSYTALGSHVVTARYTGSPDGAFAGSANVPDAIVGVTLPTTIGLSLSSETPAVRTALKYTASVRPAPDGGTVSFIDHGAPIRGCVSRTVKSGIAICNVSYATPGTHRISASYSGDAHYGPSASTGLLATVSSRPTLRIGSQRFIVTVVCPAHSGGCRLTSTVAITLHGVRRGISLKKLSAKLKAGKTERFVFALSGVTRTALRSYIGRHHHGRLVVALHLVVRDGNGNSGTQTFRYTIRSARDLAHLAITG
jgi:hypothetical protein